jgi:hypothetical protein
MPGLFIARRYVNQNGETKPVDYYFDTREKAEKFIEGVKLSTPSDHGHEFEILTHTANDVLNKYSANT